jgi:diaminopimelate epimerase
MICDFTKGTCLLYKVIKHFYSLLRQFFWKIYLCCLMMTFYKYHGTGNDFILFDNRNGQINLTNEQVALMCDRHFGIGADGLMLLEHADGYDFRMVYYNSDGNEGTMCGNGGRCITAFAKRLGLINDTANFIAIDGPHTATINADGLISLHMKDVATMDISDDHTILDTGSLHYVLWVNDVVGADVFGIGRRIRNQPEFQPRGTNVNFVQRVAADTLLVRTYERGVEDETLSCGTGVTASAIASIGTSTGTFNINIETPGGNLSVAFSKGTATLATNVVLSGPAAFVYKGEIPDVY